MRRLSLLLCAFFWISLGRGEAQTLKIQADVQKKLEQLRAEQKAGLEQLIAEALKNNPDIRVGESKVRDAEMELQRTRMKVLSEVTVVHAEMQAAQATVEEASKRYERAKQLAAKGVGSAEAVDEAQNAFVKNKAVLAMIEARLPYLLGKASPSGPKTAEEAAQLLILQEFQGSLQRQMEIAKEQARAELELAKQLEARAKAASKASSDEEFLRRLTLDLLGRTPTPEEIKEFQQSKTKDRREKWVEKLKKARMKQGGNVMSNEKAFDMGIERLELDLSTARIQMFSPRPDTPLSANLRKALNTSVTLDEQGISPGEALALVRDRWMRGVNLIVRAGRLKQDPLEISFKEPISLGAFLEYLEDELKIVFILRDYGVVVVAADERLPPGAVRVVDFWKREKAAEKPGPEKEKK
jgi:hypothetical protein